MKKFILSSYLAIATLVSFSVQAQEKKGITVVGYGSVKVVPDQVLINLGVENEANTAKEVMQETNAITSEVIKYLKRKNIPTKNIKTEQIRLNKSYRHVGMEKKNPYFLAYQNVKILLEDISSYEEVLEGLVEIGITSINGIELMTSDLEKYKTEARKKAVANAKMKAEQYAKEFDVDLFEPIYIFEINQQNSNSPYSSFANLEMANYKTEETLAEGEIEISTKVEVSYNFGPNMDEYLPKK